MNLPTEEQCLQYFEEFKVPSNIKEHCLNVRKVAVFLAKKLNEKGVIVNVDLVDRTALLHDLFKVVSLEDLHPNFGPYSEEEIRMWKKLRQEYPGLHESEVSYVFFKDNYPNLASTLKNSSNPERKDKSWEELIVNYADARILRKEIVTLQQRFNYLKETYPHKIELFNMCDQELSLFENKIKEITNIQPEQLANKIENEQ